MNIVGKILVIVNMVFALLVAGFLVIDFGTRTNYKTYSDKLKAELDVSRANTQTAQDTNRKLLDEKKAAEGKFTALAKEFDNTKQQYNATLDRFKQQAQEEKKKTEMNQFTSQRILDENTRLQVEVKDLTGLVKKREETIRTLQDDANNYKAQALANEQKTKEANERTLALLEKVKQYELERVRNEQKQTGTTPTTSVRSPDYRNPPAAYVKGMITQVDGSDPNRGQISIGSDEGLKDGNTLMVYRLNPQPEYIGTIVLRDVDHHSAVGKLLPSSTGAQRRGLKVGDEVASRIFR